MSVTAAAAATLAATCAVMAASPQHSFPGEKAGRLLLDNSNAAFDRRAIPVMVASAFAKAQHYQPPLTPRSSCSKLQRIRPSSAAAERGRADAPTDDAEPSLFPGDLPLYVGTAAHAADAALLRRLGIGAVLNCAAKDPAVVSACAEACDAYDAAGVTYAGLEARDQPDYPLLREHLSTAREFIEVAHASGRTVLMIARPWVAC